MHIKALVMVLGATRMLLGDVVQCTNGDRYTGTVLLVNETGVRLENDIHGTLNIPRAKVSSIIFQDDAAAKTNPDPAGGGLSPGKPGLPGAVSTATKPKPAEQNVSGVEGALKIDPAAIAKVQNEILGTANPEANQMFQEMVQGLASGTLNVGDIQSLAKSTLDEVRELQKELGDEDTAGLLSSYVSILEGFVKQSSNGPAPKRPARPPAPQPGAE